MNEQLRYMNGVWIPATDAHMEDMLRNAPMVNGRATYQFSKLQESLSRVKQWRVAVDAGAHVGLWTRFLALNFQTVHAFEPLELHRACFARNVPDKNVILYPSALGEEEREVMLMEPDCLASSRVSSIGTLPAKMYPLDHFTFSDVDYFKVDCVGYELKVLKGAEDTLRRCRPCVVVEQKPGYAEAHGLQTGEAIRFLESLGAKHRKNLSGVHILNWE